jgi:hypothetical protein
MSPSQRQTALPWVLFSPEVDARRPVAITWLASGARLLHVPVVDDAAFRARRGGQAHRRMGADDSRCRVCGAALGRRAVGRQARPRSEDGAASPLRSRERVRPRRRPEGALRATSTGTSDDYLAGLGRVDFALRVDGASTVLEIALAPGNGDGFLATLARAEVRPTPNRFLAALPADSQVVSSWRITPDVAAAWERLTAIMMAKAGGERGPSRRFEREARHWAAISAGDSAMALTILGSEKVSIVQAGACRDREKMRRLLRRLTRHGGDRGSHVRVVELRRAVASFDGVEVDEQQLALASPSGGQAPAPMNAFLAEPIRYAYPAGAVVSVMGAGGLPALRDAVSKLLAGAVAPALQTAIDPRAVMAVVVDIQELQQALGTGTPVDTPGSVTLNVVPHDGLVSVRLTAPSRLLQFLPMLAVLSAAPADRT